MHPIDGLDRAAREFEQRLALVTDWELPTPCPEWSVHRLVHHVIGGNLFAAAMLGGASAADAVAISANNVLGDDVPAEFAESYARTAAAFAADGALGRTYAHPMGTIPGELFVTFRTADIAAHAWDLARSIGADETLDAELVAYLVEKVEPIAPGLVRTGAFGAGPSADLPADTPAQHRFLDLLGRRP